MKRKASQIRCPECRHVGITQFQELWHVADNEITFDLVEGEFRPQEHNPPDLDPVGVRAICGCGCKWKLRGVHQITDITAE